MENKKIEIEKLTSSDAEKLIGGFSLIFSGEPQDTTSVKVNNCNGGNVHAGCGAKKGKKTKAIGANTNCKGNCVKGCGDTIKH